MDDVTALRDALVTKEMRHTDYCFTDDGTTNCTCLMVERGERMRERLDALIAAVEARAIEGSGVVEALRYALEHTDCHCHSCDVTAPAILASFPRPKEPRMERCAVCGVGRWVIAHDPEAGSRYHPFAAEAR